jgi:hypothetical protein
MSMGNCMTFICPIIAKMTEPAPTIMYIFISVSSVIMVLKIT